MACCCGRCRITESTRLVRLDTNSFRGEYYHLRQQATTLDVAAYYPAPMEVTVNLGDEPVLLPGAGVTADLFDVLGVRPALGRGFTAEEMLTDGPGIVGGTYWRTYGAVILSDGAWRSYFDAAPTAIGRTLVIEGLPHTVVGVMPPDFNFPHGVNDVLVCRTTSIRVAIGAVSTSRR